MNTGTTPTAAPLQPSIRAIERQLDLAGDALTLFQGFKPTEGITFLFEACLSLKAANEELLRLVKVHDARLIARD